jgi:hypothetical protein
LTVAIAVGILRFLTIVVAIGIAPNVKVWRRRLG